MAGARRQPPMQIFQDPSPPSAYAQVAAYDPHHLNPYTSVTHVSNDQHTLLQPPHSAAHEQIPQKARHVSSSPPPSALRERAFNAVSIPPPQEPSFRTDAPAKKTQRPTSKQSHVMNGHYMQPHSGSFDFQQPDKENLPQFYGFPQPKPAAPVAPPVKAGLKRGLKDSAPLRDRSKKPKVKDARVVEEDGPLPEPEDMPPVEDDGVKPSYSYATLIGMAILRAPNRRLTLSQIYKWISDTFAFYRDSQETGWQNSIRHNLSLSKSFSKQERPKDDPGKGHYWVINEGFEKQYHKVKSARRPTNPDGFVPAYPGDAARSHSSMPASLPASVSVVKSIDSTKFPEEFELPSSDATIPCTDPTAHDGHEPERRMPPPRQMPSSPPPADIQSSPPPAVDRSVRDNTPPRVPRPRLASNSRSGGRKRKFGFGDSGYYSSIESSATKGNPLGTLLTSEADVDRPAMKRGRAEEEIARIRGSSYDSPTKTRPYMKQPSASQLISSPFRSNTKNGDGPFTPAVVFKRPPLPPASASPNTNLRNHRNKMRELVGGSPDKSLAMLVDTAFLDKTWSPLVQIPNEESVNLIGQGFTDTFDIFAEYDYQASPIKTSSKRPRLERAATSSGILADITGTKPNMASPALNCSAFLNIPSFSPVKQSSPVKAPTSNPVLQFSLPKVEAGHTGLTPTQTFEARGDDDIFQLLQSDDSEHGIDLLQGFEKIGARASVAPNGSPSKAPRPGLHRSSTSRF